LSTNSLLAKQRERLWMTCPDLVLTDQPYPGLERLKARFRGHAYDPYRHETYAIGKMEAGGQAFRYRGAERVSTSGASRGPRPAAAARSVSAPLRPRYPLLLLAR
jgi:hypothetical protein